MNQEWSQNPPTEPGLYWVWQDARTWPCAGDVTAVEVELIEGVLCAWVPSATEPTADAVVPNEKEDAWIDAWWLGPINRPAAPSV